MLRRSVHPEINQFSRYAFFGITALSLSTGIAVGLEEGRGQPVADYLETIGLTALVGLMTGLMLSGFALPGIFVLSWLTKGCHGYLPAARSEIVDVVVPGRSPVPLMVDAQP